MLSEEKYKEIEDILKDEKSFGDVVKNCYRADTITSKQICVYFSVFIICNIIMFIIMKAPGSYKILSQVFDLGLTFSVGILGFLIAGFSVYSTFLDRDIMYFMIIYKDKGDKYSKFHKNYLFFFKPFFLLLALLSSSIFGKLVMAVWECVKVILESIIINYDIMFEFNVVGTVLWSFYLTLLIVNIIVLKDFIYNIYNSAKSIGRFELSIKGNGWTIEKLISEMEKIEEQKVNK